MEQSFIRHSLNCFQVKLKAVNITYHHHRPSPTTNTFALLSTDEEWPVLKKDIFEPKSITIQCRVEGVGAQKRKKVVSLQVHR
jgi:hypothetical protein